MRIQAKLVPQRTRGIISIVGAYRDKKTDKDIYLLANGKKVVSHLEEGDRVFQHNFESGYPLPLTFDDKEFQDIGVINFWKNHPLVVTAGYENPNFVSEQFVFEIKEERIRVDFDALTSKLKCVSAVSTMSEAERRDLTFALGSDPRGMSNKEIYVHLIGLTLNGIAIAKREMVFTFLQIRGQERIASIYANKAIQYNIVKKEGLVYKVGGRNLGTSVDSVVSMILADTDLFENYIKPEVDRIEKDELALIETVGSNEIVLPSDIENLLPVVNSAEKKKSGRPSGS